MTTPRLHSSGVSIDVPIASEYEQILTSEALAFLHELHQRFDARRRELLAKRVERQKAIDAGQLPNFLPETESIRKADWKVAPIPADLMDRRVEITGPVDRKMVINALNSGANVFMADFEDSNSPTWDNNLSGQINLRDAVRGDITYASPEGKQYALNPKRAVLLVRPRGWHLEERHVTIGGLPMSGSLMDFGLYFFHNAKTLMAKGTGPYFYLPKMQSHLEARLWNDVFVYAQQHVGIPQGTIRATVLIETILAAFEMDEILYELRDHSAGLNCGRWDYIFSVIKVFRNHKQFMLPDRSQVTMDRDFLKAYVELLIQTCHRRNIHAMGGMAAQIPIKNDPEANETALAKVRADKLREVRAGHDGTWVAHPGLVPVAKEVFDALMPGKNQLFKLREDVHVGRAELLAVPEGTRTEEGLKHNVRVGVRYLEAWLRGSGCVPLYNLMEDAATAEISRAQVWQQLNAKAITVEQLDAALASEVGAEAGGRFAEAKALFRKLSTASKLDDFLTVPAYPLLQELSS